MSGLWLTLRVRAAPMSGPPACAIDAHSRLATAAMRAARPSRRARARLPLLSPVADMRLLAYSVRIDHLNDPAIDIRRMEAGLDEPAARRTVLRGEEGVLPQ